MHATDLAKVGLALIAETPIRPRWAYYRLRTYAYHYFLNKRHQSRCPEYQHHLLPLEEAVAHVTGRKIADVRRAADSPLLGQMVVSGRWVVDLGAYGGSDSGDSGGPITINYGPSPQQMRLVSIVCRLLQPDFVLEAGVGRGFTTTSVLDVLDRNERGRLVSVEMPSPHKGFREQVGEKIPGRLRARWALELGPSAIVMPAILGSSRALDVFIHDSAANYDTQSLEFGLALERLRPGGVLIANMINNDALIETAERWSCRWAVVEQTKPSPLGLLCKVS